MVHLRRFGHPHSGPFAKSLDVFGGQRLDLGTFLARVRAHRTVIVPFELRRRRRLLGGGGRLPRVRIVLGTVRRSGLAEGERRREDHRDEQETSGWFHRVLLSRFLTVGTAEDRRGKSVPNSPDASRSRSPARRPAGVASRRASQLSRSCRTVPRSRWRSRSLRSSSSSFSAARARTARQGGRPASRSFKNRESSASVNPTESATWMSLTRVAASA